MIVIIVYILFAALIALTAYELWTLVWGKRKPGNDQEV